MHYSSLLITNRQPLKQTRQQFFNTIIIIYQMKTTLLIFIGLLIFIQSQPFGKNDIDGIASGFASFSVPTSNSNDLATLAYQHNFATPFTKTPSVALGIWDADFAASAQTTPFEFDLFVNSSNVNTLQLVFRHRPNVWRSVRAGFLACARPDLSVGTSSITTNSLIASSSTKTIELGKLANFQTSVARVYLNGFSLNANSKGIQVQIEAKSVVQNGVIVVVYTGPDSDLRTVSFSYLVFSPNQVGFLAYGGIVARLKFSGQGYQDIRNSNNLPSPLISGLVKLGSSFSLSLSSSIDNDFVFGVKQNGASVDFVYSYAAFGAYPQSICAAFPQKYAYDNSCVSACPPGSFAFAFKDGGVQCRRCSAKLGMIVNSAGNGCSCAPGLQISNGVCLPSAQTNSGASSKNNQNQNQNIPTTTSSVSSTPSVLPISQPSSLAGKTNSIISSDFVSSGVTNTASPISGVSQNSNKVTTVTSTGAVITISGSATGVSSTGNSPIVSVQPNSNLPVTNPGSGPAVGGGAIIIPSGPSIFNPANSYVPVTPSQPSLPSTIVPPGPTGPVQIAVNASSPQSCANFSNTYWTGYRCSCRVGYQLDIPSGQCIRINMIVPNNSITIIPIPGPTPNLPCRQNEVFTYNQCVCLSGFIRGLNGICIPSIVCPPNSLLQLGQCICQQGFVRQGDYCVPNIITCSANSYFNGVICVCNLGFVLNPRTNICELGNFCHPYSQRGSNGQCQCIAGYREISSGVCSQCERNAILVNNQCQYTCGVNEQYNPLTQRCECRPGYGYCSTGCEICRSGTYLVNGYCIQCPVYASFNTQTMRCECSNGFVLQNGQCIQQCTQLNQVYDQATRTCRCFAGLGRLQNGQCGLCPSNSNIDPVTQTCSVQCRPGQIIQQGRCVCQPGLGLAGTGSCINCATINGIIFSGYCLTCPTGRVWRGSSCVCPDGKIEQNGVCVDRCNAGQLIDSSGFCYSCQINEQPSNGVCVCKYGYTRDPVTRTCQASCSSGQNIINGICGSCVMGTVYNLQLRSCICPNGYYTNQYNYCQQTPILCGVGYTQLNGICVVCPVGCRTCTGASFCTSCVDPTQFVVGGICVSRDINRCGNGITEAGETCDDMNNRNGDGCSANCWKEFGYDCVGTPSYCTPNGSINVCGNGIMNQGEQCDDRNLVSGDGCSSNCQIEQGYNCTYAVLGAPSNCTKNNSNGSGTGMNLVNVIINSNTIYVTMKLDTIFRFSSQQEMTQFIHYELSSPYQPTSGYCRQRINDLATFDCLFNYPTGVPKMSFSSRFWYSKDGQQGQLTITIDSVRGYMANRSLH